MTNSFYILLLALIQAGYDFLVWGIWFEENPPNKTFEYTYRIVKFILDYPVSIFLLFILGINTHYIIAFLYI